MRLLKTWISGILLLHRLLHRSLSKAGLLGSESSRLLLKWLLLLLLRLLRAADTERAAILLLARSKAAIAPQVRVRVRIHVGQRLPNKYYQHSFQEWTQKREKKNRVCAEATERRLIDGRLRQAQIGLSRRVAVAGKCRGWRKSIGQMDT